MSARSSRLEVVTNRSPGVDGKTHFVRLCAGNGAILMTSETYGNRAKARRAAKTIGRALQVISEQSEDRPPFLEVEETSGSDQVG